MSSHKVFILSILCFGILFISCLHRKTFCHNIFPEINVGRRFNSDTFLFFLSERTVKYSLFLGRHFKKTFPVYILQYIIYMYHCIHISLYDFKDFCLEHNFKITNKDSGDKSPLHKCWETTRYLAAWVSPPAPR